MLIKTADDSSGVIAALEARVAKGGADAKHASVELRNRKAGLRAERDAAYLIDFDFAGNPNWAVVHDLRLEHGGRVAQIDHLLINRWLQVYVLETKHFHAGIMITEDGEFLRWNDFAKRYEGLPSPLAQNDRHIAVLRDVFSTIDVPARAGFRIEPEFMTFVLVAPTARIDRPKRFDTSRVIKADVLRTSIWKDIDGENPLMVLLKTATKIVSSDTVQDVAKALAAKHRPLRVESPSVADAPQRASPPRAAPKDSGPASSPPQRMAETPPQTGAPSATNDAPPRCKSCDRNVGEILYGKYGYYFKCTGCDTNTAIRFRCHVGHSPRLRKDGARFFRECEQCASSALYFTNTLASR